MKETKDRYCVVVTENQFSRNDLIQDHERRINEGWLNSDGVSNVRLGALHIFQSHPEELWRAEQSLLFTEDVTASSGPTPEEIEQQEALINNDLPPNQHIYTGFGNTQEEAIKHLATQVYRWCFPPYGWENDLLSVVLEQVVLTHPPETKGWLWKATQKATQIYKDEEHSNG